MAGEGTMPRTAVFNESDPQYFSWNEVTLPDKPAMAPMYQSVVIAATFREVTTHLIRTPMVQCAES
jgi:hypothetical protein